MTLSQLLTVRLIGEPEIGTSALRVAAVGLLLVVSRQIANELYECGPAYGRAAKAADKVWDMARTLQNEMWSAGER